MAMVTAKYARMISNCIDMLLFPPSCAMFDYLFYFSVGYQSRLHASFLTYEKCLEP